jgi:hypothetical protein
MGCMDTNLRGTAMGRMDGEGSGFQDVTAQTVESLFAECDRLRGRIAQLETELAARQREVDRLRHQASYRESIDRPKPDDSVNAQIGDLYTVIRLLVKHI